jgi:hypothetical protein
MAGALALCTATPAAATDWRYVDRDQTGMVRYLDADSVRKSGSVIAFWTMGVQYSGGTATGVTEQLGSADCSLGSYRIIETRNNPSSSLRRPTWLVSVRRDWKKFGEDNKAKAGDPMRAVIEQACAVAGQTVPPREEPAPTEKIAAAETAPQATSVPAAAEQAPAPEPVRIASSLGIPKLEDARPAAWVDLGAAPTGQKIQVDAASIEEDGYYRQAWFRLSDDVPGAVPTPLSYLLRIDCAWRTINQMALRRHGAAGAVTDQNDYGALGEGPVRIEAETVMETAYLGLCTKGRAEAIRALASR